MQVQSMVELSTAIFDRPDTVLACWEFTQMTKYMVFPTRKVSWHSKLALVYSYYPSVI